MRILGIIHAILAMALVSHQTSSASCITVVSKTPPNYDGKGTERADEFLREYEQYSHQSSEKDKIEGLLECLHKEAFSTLKIKQQKLKNNLIKNKEGEAVPEWSFMTWQKWTSIFRTKFCRDPLQTFIRRRQMPGESGSSFFRVIEGMYEDTPNITFAEEKDMCTWITEHLNEKFKLQLQLKSFTTLIKLEKKLKMLDEQQEDLNHSQSLQSGRVIAKNAKSTNYLKQNSTVPIFHELNSGNTNHITLTPVITRTKKSRYKGNKPPLSCYACGGAHRMRYCRASVTNEQ